MPYPNYTLSTTGDYVLMSTWEAAAQGEFDGTQPITLTCFNDDFGGGVDGGINDSVIIADWGVSPTAENNVTITCADGNWHEGDVTKGFAINEVNLVVYPQIPYVTVERLRVTFTTINFTNAGYRLLNAPNHTIRNSMVYHVNGDRGRAFNVGGSTETNITVENCYFHGNVGFYQTDESSAGVVSNCTIVGIDTNDALELKNDNWVIRNCVAMSVLSIDYGSGASASNVSNASQDTTATGTGAVINVSPTDGVDFVAPSTNNWRIVTNGLLDGAGADLSGDFTDDITGQTRNGWDIGAYAESYAS
jgi:hypothetical protein